MHHAHVSILVRLEKSLGEYSLKRYKLLLSKFLVHLQLKIEKELISSDS